MGTLFFGMNENPAEPEVGADTPTPKHLAVTEAERAEWARRFRESGLSIRQFSAQHDLPRMSLWRWVNQAKDVNGAVAGSAVPDFVELKLPPSIERANWAAELSLPNGTVLRLSREVPPAMLEQLLGLC
jgi:transposase-like protein